jgi:Ser/Thr protein kinase RdoA (MazF antagonist)
MREKLINWLIKKLKVNTNKVSDGYHTFEELYEHRIELWIAFCKTNQFRAWKSRRHSDGSKWKGWFILGFDTEAGRQKTYHLPNKYWKRLPNTIAINTAPEWDGHTPNDVLERLKDL